MKGEIVTSGDRLIVLDDVVQAKFERTSYNSITSTWETPKLTLCLQRSGSDILELKLTGAEAVEVWAYIRSMGEAIPSLPIPPAADGVGLLQQSSLIDRVKQVLLNPDGTHGSFF
ncbi:hypothetical protein PN499_26480 [Kamptonema animale CS-326]|jgi:hypothetical protein|uniref:hypothetical protein n=1 Tax=Kamptonema animale TaxID=92934 RepID=UPI00232BEA01|nr:hypothetical protein [Kamptonema animale]MDB9514755.1 hypothetical protein [Kamptonema animale CS-326]